MATFQEIQRWVEQNQLLQSKFWDFVDALTGDAHGLQPLDITWRGRVSGHMEFGFLSRSFRLRYSLVEEEQTVVGRVEIQEKAEDGTFGETRARIHFDRLGNIYLARVTHNGLSYDDRGDRQTIMAHLLTPYLPGA